MIRHIAKEYTFGTVGVLLVFSFYALFVHRVALKDFARDITYTVPGPVSHSQALMLHAIAQAQEIGGSARLSDYDLLMVAYTRLVQQKAAAKISERDIQKEVAEVRTLLDASTNDARNRPIAVNHAVPFTSQAPHGQWGPPFGEACEEASVIMAAAWARGWTELDRDYVADEIQKAVKWEKEIFQESDDTNAFQIMELLRKDHERVSLQRSVTVEDMKNALGSGAILIVPVAGQFIGNAYFKKPGPPYHVLLIRGYTATHFITNDPGTSRGEGLQYPIEILYHSMHDLAGQNQPFGDKVMVVVHP